MALDAQAAAPEESGATAGQLSGTGIGAGTMVLTLRGAVMVEDLRPGDKVITRDSGTAVLKSLRCHHLHTAVFRLRPDALGEGRPEQETLLAAGQRILLRDWRAKALFGVAEALVPVEKLEDGDYITALPAQRTQVFDLVFDAPHIIYAGGLEMAATAPQAAAVAVAS